MHHNTDNDTDTQTYRQFIKSHLDVSTKPRFLLIGEDHRRSSALIGLAHTIDEINKSGKKVVVITEDLRRLKTAFGGEQSYTPQKVETGLETGKDDPDYNAIESLINSGVKVYGLESKKTAPSLYLNGKTKEELYNEAMKKLPSIFRDENGNLDQNKVSMIVNAKNDDDGYDVEEFKDFLNRRYGDSNERVINTNEEIVSQMLLASKKNPGNTLIIFTGGAAHLAQSFSSATGKEVDPGVLRRLQDRVGDQVEACFFNDQKTDQKTYTPSPDVALKYASIPNRISIPSQFTTENAKKIVTEKSQISRSEIIKKPITPHDQIFTKVAENSIVSARKLEQE